MSFPLPAGTCPSLSTSHLFSCFSPKASGSHCCYSLCHRHLQGAIGPHPPSALLSNVTYPRGLPVYYHLSPPALMLYPLFLDLLLSVSIYHLLMHSYILLACVLYCLPPQLEWRPQEGKGVLLSLILFSPISTPLVHNIYFTASYFPNYTMNWELHLKCCYRPCTQKVFDTIIPSATLIYCVDM